MSNNANDRLIEEAKEYIEELTGTPLSLALEADLKHNDLEALWKHVIEARDLLREDEFTDVY